MEEEECWMKPTTTNTGPERKRACCCYSMAKNESTRPQKMLKKKKRVRASTLYHTDCAILYLKKKKHMGKMEKEIWCWENGSSELCVRARCNGQRVRSGPQLMKADRLRCRSWRPSSSLDPQNPPLSKRISLDLLLPTSLSDTILHRLLCKIHQPR